MKPDERSDSGTVPFFSVVVPVLDGERTLGACLESLRASRFRDWELLVVDDGSVDRSVEIALQNGARVLRTPGRQGPGAARNLGAREAAGEVLFFIDADCSAGPDTLERAAALLRRDGELDALFGSYDDSPSAQGIVARYKNLQHHYVHQTGSERATTFWAGCGAIRRSVFLALGGFDTVRFSRPCIEDIELGYRLTDRGGRIRLAKQVQVKHHKAWTFGGMLRSDLVDRGIPWVRLLQERERTESDLNLGWRGRVSVLLSLILVAAVAISPWRPVGWLAALAAALVLAVLNRGFYRLLLRKGGVKLMLGGMLLHWLYQLNCAFAFGLGVLPRRRAPRDARGPDAAINGE